MRECSDELKQTMKEWIAAREFSGRFGRGDGGTCRSSKLRGCDTASDPRSPRLGS